MGGTKLFWKATFFNFFLIIPLHKKAITLVPLEQIEKFECLSLTSTQCQFSTHVKIKNDEIETISDTKLLGIIITSDLSWNRNTRKLITESNKRMQFLHRAKKFTSNISDLRKIYMLQVRSKLDQSAVVWHSSITKKDSRDLERVQKSAIKVILGERYKDYQDALRQLNMETLEMRREKLCLKFAKQCLRHEKLKEIFPRHERKHDMVKRNCEKYIVKKAMTERYKVCYFEHAEAPQPIRERKEGNI